MAKKEDPGELLAAGFPMNFNASIVSPYSPSRHPRAIRCYKYAVKDTCPEKSPEIALESSFFQG